MDGGDAIKSDFSQLSHFSDLLYVDHIRFGDLSGEAHLGKSSLEGLLTPFKASLRLVACSSGLTFASSSGGFAHAASLTSTDSFAIFCAALGRLEVF